MEAILRELTKLESKSCAANEDIEALQAGIDALERWQAALNASSDDAPVSMDEDAIAEAAVDHVEVAVAKLIEGHKEWSSTLSKYSKTVDKKFAIDIAPLLPAVTDDGGDVDEAQMFFSSESSKKAINTILLTHFSRCGDEKLASVFAKESGTALVREKEHQFQAMHRIAASITSGDLKPVFAWINENRAFLQARRPSLEYRLHRSHFVRLLLSDTYTLPPSLAAEVAAAESSHSTSHVNGASFAGAKRAIAYVRQHTHVFYGEAAPAEEVSRLVTSSLYLPLSRLVVSPYGGLFTPDGQPMPSISQPVPTAEDIAELYHAPQLVELFTSEYCASLGMPKDLPLKIVTDIGGGGALAKIAKVRGVMKEKRTEWTTTQELPVEIPLPPEYRFHSVFACPVSKEQATEANPPMMMPCGHVVASQTLQRLCKGGQTVRCPYCPLSSAVNQAIRLYF